MNRTLSYILFAGALLLLAPGCRVYKNYSSEQPTIADSIYRDTVGGAALVALDTTSLGDVAWANLFADLHLQALIREGLDHNSDLRIAFQRIEQAEAALTASRLAYTPSFNLNPQGTLAWSESGNVWIQSYALSGAMSWEIDLFGRLRNAKESKKSALLQTEAYTKAVRSQLIAGIANSYYALLMLDEQLRISQETTLLWERNVETMRALKSAGMTNEAAVAQSEANYYMIRASLSDLEQAIRESENALSVLLGSAPRTIARGKLSEQELPSRFGTGFPIQLLSARPDVQAAEMALAAAFYTTNEARAAFYPQLTIGGSGSWTNLLGETILNPAAFVATFVGGLTVPIFNKGANKARLRMAQAQQEEAKLIFEQTILQAGSEVSDALFQFHTSGEKRIERTAQVGSLTRAVYYTQELFRAGEASYLEILTAQQALLTAQLDGATDNFEQLQSVVNLYRALGGGR